MFAEKSGNNFTDGVDDIKPLPKGVSIHLLDNGMQVLLIENPALPMVGVNVVVKVGTAYETFATSGMSHMLEHLLFNGTDSLTQKELYDATDKIGGYNNANTGEYYTNYMMVTPSENIYDGMNLQAGMLFHSTMPEEKFEKEKSIVMEEIAKSLANSSEQADRNVISIIYKGHALSLPTLGTYETIKNMKRDDVFRFYKNHYLPNNMVMSVIGNFKSEEMLNKINEIYGEVSPGNVELPESPVWGTGFEKQKGNAEVNGKVFHRFYKGKRLMVNLLFELPDNLSTEFYSLLELSLDNNKDSLQNMINLKFPDAISKLEFQTRSYPIKSYLQVTINLKDDKNIDEIINSFNEKLKNLNLSLPSETVNAEAIKTKTSFYRNVEKPHMFGIYNASTMAEYGLEAVFNSYSEDGYKEAGKILDEFSVGYNPVVIIQHPIVKDEKDSDETEIKTSLFENGNKKPVVIVKQNSNSELLAIHYMFKNKSAYEEKFGRNAATIWHDAFGQRMELPENQKESINYGLKFTVNDNPYIPMDNIYLSPAFGYIRAEGLADDVDGAISFLNNQMLNFIPTEEEYNKASKKLMGLKMMKHDNNTKQIFEKNYKGIIYEKEKYSIPSEDINYENLLKFGKEYFNPQNIIISVVSPASGEEVNNYFSAFYRDDNIQPINEPAYQRNFANITEAHTMIDTVGGEQAYLFYGFISPFEKADEPALQALSLMLGNKIVFDIREKQGMAYRMSAGIKFSKDKALYYINMGTRPENVDKLIPQFPGLLTVDYTNSFTEDELIKSVNMYLGRMMFRRLSSINQAYYLAHSYYFEGDINADRELLDALKNVTLDDVNRVAEKYLHVENPVKVIVR
jgi:zinc protease